MRNLKKMKLKKPSTILKNTKKAISKKASKFKEKTGKNFVLSLIMLIGIGIASIVILFGAYIVIFAPDFNTNRLYSKEASVLYDKNGEEITRIGVENRVLVTYHDLPQVLVDALIATEDSRFFQHNGFDAARFLKASINQLMGRDAGGASTLTMQLAKNVYNGNKKSIVRKFSDIYMAIFKIEKSYTKEEIIEFYVNSQWLGAGNTNNYADINGVEQGSQAFFGKSVSDLTLPEAALLVGLFNNPSYYSPIRFPEHAKERQKTVLKLMVRHGYITEEEANVAASIPIESLLKAKSSAEEKKDDKGLQAFIDYVVDDVIKKTNDDPRQVPMAIYTTLDRSVQDVVTALENGETYTYVNDKVQNGIAVTSVQDGSIMALGAGRNYVYRSLNRALVRQQPGSTIKPILDYGPLIEYNDVSTEELFFDEPYTYSTGGSIRNYDGKYKGVITLREALIDSRNVPAFQAFQRTTTEQKSDFAHSLGIDFGSNLYESASIGGFDPGASPLEMSAAYGAFGRMGYYIEPYSFTKIVYLENGNEYDYKYTKTRVMSEDTAYMITDILVDGGKRGVGGSINVAGTDIAAKGGTTTIDEDQAKAKKIPTSATPSHWNCVYSPSQSICLWYGYDKITSENYTTSASGGTARRKLMSTIANKTIPKGERFTKPSGVIEEVYEIGTVPAQLPSENTPGELTQKALFKEGTEPTTVSSRFQDLSNPSNVKAAVNESKITITWDAIPTPDAINESKLRSYFNESFGVLGEKYYDDRISYNRRKIGDVGYQIYLKNNDDNLISLGFTDDTHYTYETTDNGEFTFVVKSCYEKFKDNMSSGAQVKATVTHLPKPVEPIPTPSPENPDPEPDPTNPVIPESDV